MVYGNKHLNKLNYDVTKYKFVELVTDLFGTKLSNLHLSSNKEYELITELGKDSHTEFHKKFYTKYIT